jgi:hypothetical protein
VYPRSTGNAPDITNSTAQIGGQDADIAAQTGDLTAPTGSTTANSLGLFIEYAYPQFAFFLAESHPQRERCWVHGNRSNRDASTGFLDSYGLW